MIRPFYHTINHFWPCWTIFDQAWKTDKQNMPDLSDRYIEWGQFKNQTKFRYFVSLFTPDHMRPTFFLYRYVICVNIYGVPFKIFKWQFKLFDPINYTSLKLRFWLTTYVLVNHVIIQRKLCSKNGGMIQLSSPRGSTINMLHQLQAVYI